MRKSAHKDIFDYLQQVYPAQIKVKCTGAYA
jgi:hypothetical protein